jgi:ATP-dependent DNA helicase RecQ
LKAPPLAAGIFYFDPVLNGFDDTPLRDFLKDKEVLSVRDHFFVKHDTPYLVVLVTYTLARPEVPPSSLTSRLPADTSWWALVTAEELPLFNALRDWCSERSKCEGVPPYVICTNRQFAATVKARPQSLSTLAEIEGFGKAKLEKYGAEILAILAPASEPQPPARPPLAQDTAADGHAPA